MRRREWMQAVSVMAILGSATRASAGACAVSGPAVGLLTPVGRPLPPTSAPLLGIGAYGSRLASFSSPPPARVPSVPVTWFDAVTLHAGASLVQATPEVLAPGLARLVSSTPLPVGALIVRGSADYEPVTLTIGGAARASLHAPIVRTAAMSDAVPGVSPLEITLGAPVPASVVAAIVYTVLPDGSATALAWTATMPAQRSIDFVSRPQGRCVAPTPWASLPAVGTRTAIAWVGGDGTVSPRSAPTNVAG